MIILYHAGGARDFTIFGPSYSKEQLNKLKHNAIKLLHARGEQEAADLFHKIPFEIRDALNEFGDEFHVLYASVPLELYEQIRTSIDKSYFAMIAKSISEIGPFIRFVAVDLSLENPEVAVDPQHYSTQLKDSEINKLVYNYIGVSGGYLGDFSYRTHHEFYINLDLDINPYDYEGTTRERFTKILKSSPPLIQAKILEGILQRYPVGSSELRTQERHDEIRSWILRLRGSGPIDLPVTHITSEVVLRALADAEQLIQTRGATSGVDRMHTALHGYLRAVCMQSGLETDKDASITELFKVLRGNHPAFQDLGPRSEDITKVLRALSTVIDALNPIRNRASIAHPNDVLLDEPEAILVINAVRTLLAYLDARLRNNRNCR